MKITEHFSVEEFACRDGTPYPAEWIETRLRPLCEALEVIRAELGSPIRILSGYRSPAHNSKVGGAKQSQHMLGTAADIVCDRATPQKAYFVARRLYREGKIKIGGAGLYASWIHLDVRPPKPDGSLYTWEGKGVGSEA